jgi:superfamily II DNA or RNA helicase
MAVVLDVGRYHSRYEKKGDDITVDTRRRGTISQSIREEGGRYHSRYEKKGDALQQCMSHQARTIVATSALGSGIDLPDVRAIIHIGAPQNLLGDAQESGRRGFHRRLCAAKAGSVSSRQSGGVLQLDGESEGFGRGITR